MKRTASLILFLAGGLIAGTSNGSHAKVSPEILNSNDPEMDVLLVYEDSDDPPARQQRDDKVRSFGGRNFRNFQGLGIGAVRTSRALLDELKKDAKIRFIAPDRPIRATASGSATYDQVTVRTVLGVTSSVTQTGASVGVAVIDSGVSNLAGFGTSGACSTSRIVYSQNFASDAGTNDLFGHGSHVASILGSNASCDASYSTSVAPGVKIINLRVLNALGIGSDSGVISAIDRAIALKSTYNIRVINLSLGRTVADSLSTTRYARLWNEPGRPASLW